MKRILYIAAIVSAAISFWACDADSFEQIVTFDVPKEAPRLVVSCEYLNGSDSLQVFVSATWNSSDTDLPSSKMDNCKVELYKGTEKIVELPYKLTQKAYIYTSGKANILPQGYYAAKMNGTLSERETYTLKVSAAGFETVEAKSIVPAVTKIKNVTFKKDGFKTLNDGGLGGGGTTTKDLLAIEFDDPNDENYYIIECIEYQKDTLTQKVFQVRKYFSTNQKFNADIFGDDSSDRSLLFTDEIFNSKAFTFKMGVYTDYPEYFNTPDGGGNNFKNIIEGYDIRLHSISKERFLFNNSLQAVYNNEGNPFGEPIPLYTNFDKGMGIFSFINTSRYFVKIK
jgi:Domain of unknown function (DUF4249)